MLGFECVTVILIRSEEALKQQRFSISVMVKYLHWHDKGWNNANCTYVSKCVCSYKNKHIKQEIRWILYDWAHCSMYNSMWATLRTLTPCRGSAGHPWSSGSCPWPHSPGNCWVLEKKNVVPWAAWTELTAGLSLWSIWVVWNVNILPASVARKCRVTQGLGLTKIPNKAVFRACLNMPLPSREPHNAYRTTHQLQLLQ